MTKSKELKTLKDLTNRYGYDVDSASWSDLRDAARDWAGKIIRDMVIDSSKIGPITINERGILTIEIGITSDIPAMNQAIGMLAFIKHFFNLGDS